MRASALIWLLYLSNRPLFLWVYWRNKPRGMLGEHSKSLRISRLAAWDLQDFLVSSQTYQVVYCACKHIERVVYRFYEIAMKSSCTFVIKLLNVLKIIRWRDKPIPSTERMKTQTPCRTQSNATKTFETKKEFKKKRKSLSVKGKKLIN